MENVRESPSNGCGEKRQAQQDQVHGCNEDHIGEPNALAIEP